MPLPFVHTNAPIYLAGIARPGPTRRENRAVHAMARLLLHGAIDNIQCSWVKLGDDGCREVLQGGVNDLGGTLMEETISRMAGSQHGSFKTISQFAELVAPLERPLAPAHHDLRAARTGTPGGRGGQRRGVRGGTGRHPDVAAAGHALQAGAVTSRRWSAGRCLRAPWRLVP